MRRVKKHTSSCLLALVLVVFAMQTIPENVLANNGTPVVILKTPGNIVTISPNKPITFDGSESFDPDNTNQISYYWWIVDGVYKWQGSTADKKYFTYTFTLPAGVNSKTYQIKLMVRDNEYTTNSKTITVTVHNGKGRTEYYLTDHLGSIRTTIDDQGNVIGYDDYYPFGLAMPGRSLNSGTPNDLNKFTGHERDQEGGLNLDYMLARNYDPEIGRFLSVDPLAHLYFDLSPYCYVANNPIKYIDPDGRFIGTLIGTVVGSAAGAYDSYRKGGDVWAGAAEGAVSGAIAGIAVDLAVAATVATGGVALVIGAGAAAGAIGGAVGAVAGDATGQVVASVNKGSSVSDAVSHISTENMAESYNRSDYRCHWWSCRWSCR